jgi:cytochrome b6-f complex iron-sulfur subunit
MKLAELTRRAFLKLSLTLSGIVTLTGIAKFLSYEEAPKIITRTTLDNPDSYPPGSIIPILEVQAWLLRDQNGLYALSGVCTHLGCSIRYIGEQFECPCHGSKFDLNGTVLNGPAISSLRYVELSRSPDNLLVIDTEISVPATQRLN